MHSSLIISSLTSRSRPLYGNPFNPIFEGSGGGSDVSEENSLSSGGGVIYIEAIKLIQMEQSKISSNGSDNDQYELDYGGGSGGSIQIHTYQLRGNNSRVRANGGKSFGNGGSGSGGRIKLNFT